MTNERDHSPLAARQRTCGDSMKRKDVWITKTPRRYVITWAHSTDVIKQCLTLDKARDFCRKWGYTIACEA